MDSLFKAKFKLIFNLKDKEDLKMPPWETDTKNYI